MFHISGYFRQWDYGLIKNLKVYGTVYPPDYKLVNIFTPVYLFHGLNDYLAATEDVLKLHEELGNSHNLIIMKDPNFSHTDFTYGMDAKELIYNSVLDFMKIHWS